MDQRSTPGAPAEEGFMSLGRGRMTLAYVSASFGLAAMAMCGFLVPLRAKELGAPLEIIGVVVGVGALLPMFLSVSVGALSDRLGARRVYAYSALFAGAAALLSALTTSYWILAVLQIVAGLASSTAWLASQAYLASLGRPEQLAGILGKMSFSTNAGMVVSPILIGASSDLIGFQWSFATVAAIALCFALIGWILPEARLARDAGRRGSAAGFGTARRLLRLKGVQVILILTLVRVGSISAWMSFYPLLLVERGFASAAAGTVVAAHALVATFLALGAARLAALMGNVPAVVLGLLVGAAGIGLSPVMGHPWLVYVPAFLVGIGQGISLPLLIATVSEETPPGERGVALGIRQTANQFGMVFAPIALGVLGASIGLATGFLLTALASGGLLGAGMWLHRAVRRPGSG